MSVRSFLKKYWITIWLWISICSMTTFVCYGAYTGVITAKRVVSLSNHNGILFSSHYMFRTDTDVQNQLFVYQSEGAERPNYSAENPPNTLIDVCNYDLSGNVYSKDFRFKIKAKLVNPDGSDIDATLWNALENQPAAYTIGFKKYSPTHTVTDDEENTTTVSYSTVTMTLDRTLKTLTVGGTEQEYLLAGTVGTTYLFEIKYDVNDIINPHPTYAVYVEADPVEGYTDISTISGKLCAIQSGTQTDSKWTGRFSEQETGKTPADYDAINYEISGMAAGTVTITYKSNIVEISKEDYSDLPTPISKTVNNNAGTTSLSFAVDPNAANPANAKSKYDIRFYWKDGPDDTVAFNDTFIKTEFA